MALKLELKPNERIMLGDCVVTNSGHRTRLMIDGSLPILREKEIMSLAQADSLAKRIYLALQFMYLAKNPRENYAIYLRLVHAMRQSVPDAAPLIDCINNQILSGHLYKALKEARKLIAFERGVRGMNYASKAYTKVSVETASPRELEATLLLQAAAKLQAVHNSWRDKPVGLHDALLYNRRLWMIFLDAVTSETNKLPLAVRNNLKRLGIFIMAETFSLMTKPKPDHLMSIIKINRGIATGLRAKS